MWRSLKLLVRSVALYFAAEADYKRALVREHPSCEFEPLSSARLGYLYSDDFYIAFGPEKPEDK